ncbi:MAG: RnfABCDGE type electron transport complex subunit B, partial [Desulfohalobiaceae bacterium]|nr:RnfABCDGE type electron transport complex subunit B [Desulfohalobiaceae bacterium]
MPILTAVAAMAFLGLALSIVLGLAAKVFYVYVDPRIEQICDALPGANCGGCGYAGCSDFAEAIVNMGADPGACVAAGASTTEACCSIMGISAGVGEKYVARIFCQGSDDKASKRFAYNGAQDCAAAIVSTGGDKACQYGCIALGSCVRSCPFDALSMGSDGLPIVNEELCTGCGNCVQACPRDIPRLIPMSQKTANLCSTHDAGKVVKQVCSTGCIGCSVCKKKCPEEAVSMVDKLAVVDPDVCTGQGVCIEKCPTGSMVSLQPGAEFPAPSREAEQEA